MLEGRTREAPACQETPVDGQGGANRAGNLNEASRAGSLDGVGRTASMGGEGNFGGAGSARSLGIRDGNLSLRLELESHLTHKKMKWT